MATEARDLMPETPERINPVPENVDLGGYKYGWHDPVNSVFTPKRGLSHDVVEEISAMKQEPEWMRTFRHKSLDYFLRRPMPQWGGDLDRDRLRQHLLLPGAPPRSRPPPGTSCPADIKNTYDRLGIPEAEKQRLIAGVGRPVRERGRLPQGPRGPGGAGRPVPGHRHRPARSTRSCSASTGGTGPAPTTTSSRR